MKNQKMNPLNVDPTRTGLLRNKISADVESRFNKLSHAINNYVNKQDSLVLNAFAFTSLPSKLEAYKKWLAEQVKKGILIVDEDKKDTPWLSEYIESSYKLASTRAYAAVRKAKLTLEGQKEFASSFSLPVTQQRLQLLYTRAFDQLKGVTQAMGQSMSRVLADSLAHGLGARDAARLLVQETGLAKKRALVVARTELINAYSNGQLDTFDKLGIKELGVQVEYLTAGDSRVCPRCQDLNGKIFKSVDAARGVIPVHPNAVFAQSTFVSYGKCQELVRSWYNGPSVVLSLGRGKRSTTIGPNHPVMTRRGMILAAELDKSDEVLYDYGLDKHASGFDFKQVPTVQNCFESLVRLFGNSCIVSSTSDLHGDVVFCQSEVEGILSECSLLPVLDSFGIEIFRDQDFTRTNMKLESFSSLSCLYKLLNRSLSSSNSIMSSSNLSSSLGGRHSFPFEEFSFSSSSEFDSPMSEPSLDRSILNIEVLGNLFRGLPTDVPINDRFVWRKIHNVSFSEYKGWAFDATTETSLYCSDGLVVSNCRCAWVPYVDVQAILGRK